MLDRRTLFGLLAAVGLMPRSAVAETWPHPHLGREPKWTKGDKGALGHGEYVLKGPLEGVVLTGVVIIDGEMTEQGRIYTTEEWEVVKDDVHAFLKRRNKGLGW